MAVLFGARAELSADELSRPPEELAAGFRSPPHPAKPSAYWIWLNGYLNRDYLDKELQEFADHGVGGLLIFDMGAVGDPRFLPPAGPAFLGEESLENIALACEKAKQFGLDLQLAPCSSWDLGGSWVEPAQASMALYRTELRVEGPQELDVQFPDPDLPPQIIRGDDGKPAYSKDIALLAIRETRRLPGHEFIFRLAKGELHQIAHVVMYNSAVEPAGRASAGQSFAKNFSVAVSSGDLAESDFHEVVNASLQPHSDSQRFDFPQTEARFVRLRILNGYDPDFSLIQLGEFEVYSTSGVNVVRSTANAGESGSGELIYASSNDPKEKKWAAANLVDGKKSGSEGSWSFGGLPPLVIEDRSQIFNLSDRLDPQGNLRWKVPKGKWTLMRFVCANTGERLKVPSPKSDGLATDHFSSEATRAFLQTVIARLKRRLGDLKTAGIKQLYLPSYEVSGQLWTPDFLEEFKKYRHYDMTPFLPVLAGCRFETDELTRRFLYDFEKTRGDLLVDAYYRTAAEVAHEAGLEIEAEAGGPGPPIHAVPVDALKALGAVDEMRGEFWPWRPNWNQLWVVKETACAAHIYGRNYVHMESFTGFRHWQDGPLELKPSADRAFCEGMNHVVWHTSTHQPPEAGKPGWVYGAGTHLTPNLAWWPFGKPFLTYLARCSYLLQQGKFVGDVCYYYGDQGSNFVPAKHTDPSLGFGYDYDVVNSEVILSRMTVQNGRLTLPDGTQYELLVLPERPDINLEVLRKIDELVRDGATIVGPKPNRSNGLTDFPNRDRQVKELADRMWGEVRDGGVIDRKHGKGTIILGRSLRAVLEQRGIGPDFDFMGDGSGVQIDFIHRRSPDADIYFIRNRSPNAISGTAEFRISGKTPELWFPDSGETCQVAVFEEVSQVIRLPLSLDPNGSVFVVFRKPIARVHLTSATPALAIEALSGSRVRITANRGGHYQLRTSERKTIDIEVSPLPPAITIAGPWTIHFPPGWGAPESITLNTLSSWTNHSNSAIRHFSGIARYETTFDVPNSWLKAQQRIQLDLGRLWSVGQVRLNGDLCGTLWKPKYCIDVTHSVRPGQNQLEVEVANTWANRLVGDAHLPLDQRYCRTNITTTGEVTQIPWSEVPLHESGLFGPVQLVPLVDKTISLSE